MIANREELRMQTARNASPSPKSHNGSHRTQNLCYSRRRKNQQPTRIPAKEHTITLAEIILIGAALSADAMSVTICNVLANPNLPRSRVIAMPVLFGLFQGIMPLAGYFAGSLAASVIEAYAGIITLIILGVIGGKMVWDGLHEDEAADEEAARDHIGYTVLLAQAVATSIDAFAVGVSFAATGENIWADAGIIALCTFLLCLVMPSVGRRFGAVLGARAQVVGGIILIAIGVKALFM